MKSSKCLLPALGALCLLLARCAGAADEGDERIRPYENNPRYWQYRGQPVLLVGGSKEDSLFQLPDLEEHLEAMVGAGGNYVRNTMSARQDHGFEVYAYGKREDGRYDLDTWNDEYWRRFERLLRYCAKHGVIVQVEVWDRFDHSQEHWQADPYRPANNVNYGTADSGLKDKYPAPAWRDRQPFFHTIPGMPMYDERLDVVRRYQERFVAKLLSYSLEYGNVLYCMDNETSTPPAWGRHWIAFIQRAAKARGVDVYCSDMFNDGYEAQKSRSFAQAFDDPQTYGFIDISQINSRIFNEEHWKHLRWVMERVSAHPRPVNHVKVYGSGETKWGSGTPADGVERFWRNLLAGSAAVRFHRDGAGNGLQPIAQASIRAVREVEKHVKFWDLRPRQELLGEREPDEAYLAAGPGAQYVLYFTAGGAVTLNLEGVAVELEVVWIDISTGRPVKEGRLEGDHIQVLAAPGKGPYVAVIR